MSILSELTIKNLKLNKKRTIVTIIGIILSTALMVGIGLLFSTFQSYMIKDIISYNGGYHAKYNNVNSDKIDILKKEDNLKYFYEEGIGFSRIDSENDYKPYLYINGVSDGYFDELKLVQGRMPENNSEVVISEHISSNGGLNYKVGDVLTLEYGYREFENEKIEGNTQYIGGENLVISGTKTYKIVGVVERSNYEDYSASGYSIFTLKTEVKDEASLYVIFDKTKRIIKQSEELAKKLGYSNYIEYNASLLAMYGESTYSNIMSTMVGMLIIMLALVSIGCIIVIYNSFAISVMERKREFGLLSSVGATKRQLSYMVFFEAVVTMIIGIILGIGGAYLGIGVVVAVLNQLLEGVLEYSLTLTTNGLFIVIPVIFMIIVILISAIIPARRASKVSPIEAIRQNDDIKINKKKIKTSKLITKLFGVEGEIALKNIKRNKKKYRITTISLFISIVLFISFSAYMDYTLNFTDNMISKPDYDIAIFVYGDKDKEVDKITDEIINDSGTDKYIKYSSIDVPFKKSFKYTKDYQEYMKVRFIGDNEYLDRNYEYISIVILDNDSYNNYKKEIGLAEDKVILYNKYKGVTYNSGKRVNYDIDVISGNDIKLSMCKFPEDMEEDPSNIDGYCTKHLNNLFVTNKGIDMASELDNFDSFKLVMNKRIFDVIMDGYQDEVSSYHVNIASDNYSELNKKLEELDKYEGVYYTNITEEMKMENNLTIAIKILMYGFISLVTLIGVTSVFNTISTSMALRKREFAILRSIGLTKGGFNKILFFESLFFGFKSLLYGIPVSLGVTVLIHLSMSEVLSVSSIIIPWSSILVAIVMVFVIVLLTMLYSTSKIKKHNIIEQIREENI